MLALMDQCDLGRFAPGAGGVEAREEALREEMELMEEWPA